MEYTTRQYNVLISPYSEADDTPGCAVHMRVTGDFEKFYGKMKKWRSRFHSFKMPLQKSQQGNYKIRVHDGVGEDVNLYCDAEEMIFALLYCCADHGVKVSEINCKGTVYKDISYITFLKRGYENKGFGVTHPLYLLAKKDGNYVIVYFFGPYVDEFYGEVLRYPVSNGIVELEGRQLYIGTYRYEEYMEPSECHTDKSGEKCGITDVIYCDEEVHVFLETDGKDVTFSILLDGRLYRKISKTDEKVIFHYTSFDSTLRSACGSERGENPKDVVFVNKGGKYLYTVENRDFAESRFDGVIFTPPQVPDLDHMDEAGGRRLCRKYIHALYAAFSDTKKYRPAVGGYLFERIAENFNLLLAETEDFVLTGEFAPPLPGENHFSDGYYDLEYADIDIESVAFTKDDMEVALIPKENHSLAIEVRAEETCYFGSFGELNKRNFFSGAGLPETIRFDRQFTSFVENLEIYRNIRRVILESTVGEFLRALTGVRQELNFEDMEKVLYGDGMIPDKGVVSFALELQNRFKRTGEIPNIALTGRAGTGKSLMAEKLGDRLFGKKIMKIPPSDLKSPYIGGTQGVVVKNLIEAADTGSILFIDEAYVIMEDKHGREAISILLPLMTGDKTDAHMTYWEKGRGDVDVRVDFAKGIVTTTCGDATVRKTISRGVPPIWIAGYEEDIRLMISQNQGLFRRFRRVTLEPPTTSELYRELIEKTQDMLSKGDSVMRDKCAILDRQFRKNEISVLKFFRWGAQPQNSRYFASHSGVQNFFDRCLDSIDFSRPEEQITDQIEQIMTLIQRDIRHQLDTVRRKGDSNIVGGYDDSERVEMVFDNKTRFEELIGCDSQIEYMRSIIDMLVRKSEYGQFHITVPRGALLFGAPGVGKTFFARAMAGELQERFSQEAPDKRVGFMSLSAPEITAKPVSFIGSIFDAAEEYDVCVIFIDEVDAIAKERFRNNNYSHFIELIKQMDGMEQRSNVFILAATNAPEFLDPAFVRTGRIDKKLAFTLPDRDARHRLAEKSIKERCGALKNFEYKENAQNREKVGKLAWEVAEITRGYTPGDIENVINTAYVLYDQERRLKDRKGTGRSGPDFGNPELNCLYLNIYEAVERNDTGDPHPARKEKAFSTAKNDQSCSSTSVHETGHALVGILCGREPEKITSLPRGSAMGYVIANRDRLWTKTDYENRIRISMGGRIAEEIVYGEENISVGASSDMRTATHFARIMVEEAGFTEQFRFMALREDATGWLGINEYTCSESFREESDQVVNGVLKKLYEETREMLSGKRELIITLAEQVFKKETMTGKEFTEFYQKSQAKGI